MNSTSVIELSKSALQHNLDFLRKEIGDKVIFSSVIKGNAYGHGIKDFVPLAYSCGIRHFSVFSADEAYEVVKTCPGGNYTIMIMGEVSDEDIGWAIENDIEFFVFTIHRLEKAIGLAEKVGKPALVHLEIETGMNRTGFNSDTLKKVKKIIKGNENLVRVKGMCTHYAGAESIANYLRVQQQHKHYNKMYKYFSSNNGLKPATRHTACSAATIMYPQTRMDMVRIGILQYGFWPSPETFLRYIGSDPTRTDPLKRIMRWKSKIIATKSVNAGEFIGYGTSYLAHEHMKIGVVPVGYGHGYSRTLSNVGRVLVRGHRVGVVGVVNMNMMTVDISEIPEVEIGDEVILIGEQGDLNISVSSFSEFSNQLNYELLTRLPHNIERKVVE